MHKIVLWILLLLCSWQAFGQDLPRGFAEGEKELMPQYIRTATSYNPFMRGVDVPGPIRSMAEWEELQGLIISWTENFRDIQAEIVRSTIPQCRIIIACSNPDNVSKFLASKGISDSLNVQYVIGRYNSIWVRDYGPNSVYLNDVDSLYLTDWIYNRPRYQDDTLARQLSRALNLPLIETNNKPDDLVHTGGNYMSDGQGTAFSSLLVMDENGIGNTFGFSIHTEPEVDSLMAKYMGTKVYAKMETLPYDGIHHIDMHMKILDEQTILVGKYANDVADGAQINANIAYLLDHYKNYFGKPFTIKYIPMPPGPNGRYPDQNGDYRTYTNSVFVNKTVIVPFYEEKYDTIARRIYEEALPGYQIVGINCNKIIPSLGAIHCITKEVGVTDPLLISVDIAQPIINSDNERERTIHAIVKNRSGIDEVWLHFTLDGSHDTTDSLKMELTDSEKSIYRAIIPTFKKEARYYITAKSISGKTISRPMTAPEGYFKTVAIPTASTRTNTPQRMHIFPNPARSLTCVDVDYPMAAKVDIRLTNGLGNVVATLYSGEWNPNSPKVFFDAPALTPGLYFVKMEGKNIFSMQQVVIIR